MECIQNNTNAICKNSRSILYAFKIDTILHKHNLINEKINLYTENVEKFYLIQFNLHILLLLSVQNM